MDILTVQDLLQLYNINSDITSYKRTQTSLSQLIYYGFFTQPSPAFGVIDFYILNPLDTLLRKSFKVADLTLRERLGGGNYGQVTHSCDDYEIIDLEMLHNIYISWYV